MAATEEPTEPTSSGVGVRSYDAALCLIPPRQLWPSIDRLRMLYDKAYEKWPPHVNLLYPFVVPDNLSLASELILSKLRDWSQEQGNSRLRVRLDEAGEFFHKHSNTIYICDKDPTHVSRLAELRRLILSALGQNEGDDQMHMTIGQSEDKNSSPHKFLLDKARLLPAVVWDINELHIFVRERTQVVGNTTSQMRLWGTIDLRSLSLTQEKEPIALLGSDGLSQMLGTESGSTRESESSIRLPYVFSPSDQKWALYSTQPPVDEASLPQGLSIASYNVLAEFHHPPSHDRYPIIIRNLLEQLAAAEVLVLEEVTDDFLSYLLRDENIRQAYRFVSHGPPEQLDIEPLPSHINTIILSKLFFSWNWISFRQHHKGSIIAKFENIGKECENGRLPAILSTAHLTCGFTDGSVAKKKLELQSLLKYLSDSYPENPWIVVGDFNITTSAYTIDAALKKKAISPQTATYLTDLETSLTEAGLVDAWSYARVQFGDSSFDQDERHTSEVFEGEEGATFDPTTNELSAEIVGNGFNNRPQRYDRILIKGQDFFNISGFNMFGKNKGPLGHETAGEGSDATEVPLSYGSDHWGVRCSLKITSGTSERHMDDSSKLSVPVTLNMAPGPLGDVSELRERLAKRNVFPSEEDITARQAALSLLKEIIIEEADSVNSRGKPVFVLVPVGSYGLGVWTPSSDIDCLCIGPVSPRVFFALATQRLRNASARGVKILRRVRAHSGTMIELEVLGIKMDLQYCPATFIAETWPYAMSLPPTDPAFTLSVQTLAKLKPVRDLYYLRRTVPDFVAFKLAHQAIKFWAKQRGIYAAKFGYLGGIHISILLSRVSKLISYDGKTVSVPTVLTTFFDHYANFDWKNHMAFDPFFHKRPRYVRTAREPMVILGYHAPALNTAIAASPPSVRTMSDEFKRANALLSRDGMTWADFLGDETSEPGATEFLRCYKTYIKIDAQFWGVSLAKGSSFVGWLESRCVMLLVDLNRRLPNMHARIWPARFVGQEAAEGDQDYQGYYLVGLDRLDGTAGQAVARDEIKIMMGTLRTVLEKFEGQIRGDEKYFDPKSCWMSASLVKQSELGDLRLDVREWGEHTPGDDESDDEEEEEEEPEDSGESLGSDAEGRSKPKKHSAPNHTLPRRPAYTGKFRSSADVISRLRWDPEMDSGDYVVGYEDRFLGIRERPLDQWKSEQTDEEFIPQHRIEYFKRRSDGVIVWNRKERKDEIFGSGVSSVHRRNREPDQESA